MHKLINNVHGRNDQPHGHDCRNTHFHRKTNNIFLPRKSLCPSLLALITILILSMLISVSVINGSDSILARSITESVIELLSLREIHPSILGPVILALPCKLVSALPFPPRLPLPLGLNREKRDSLLVCFPLWSVSPSLTSW